MYAFFSLPAQSIDIYTYIINFKVIFFWDALFFFKFSDRFRKDFWRRFDLSSWNSTARTPEKMHKITKVPATIPSVVNFSFFGWQEIFVFFWFFFWISQKAREKMWREHPQNRVCLWTVASFLWFFFAHELKKSKADQSGWPWAGERRVEAASATAS